MRFTHKTVENFAAASRDFNPLHMSATFARATPFGDRVVHGACGVLAACGLFQPPADCFPSRVRVLFYQPPFLDTDYRTDISFPSERRAVVKLLDGSADVIEIVFEFDSGAPVLLSGIPTEPQAPTQVARLLSETDVAPGLAYEGLYNPRGDSYEALLQEFGIARNAWGDALPIAVMASSYLTGMEMPGERALYFQLNASFPNVPFALPATFRQELAGVDRRGMLQSHFRLSSGESVWATGDMKALMLPPRAGIPKIAGTVPPDTAARFAGKVAVVVGGSRGFGSALALTMAAAGATVVILYARSAQDAARLQAAAADLPGRIIPTQCDATDIAACSEVAKQIAGQYGRLDWLVCSGVPALHTRRVEAEAFQRMQRYMTEGFALVLAPLCSFVGLVSESNGAVVMISSSAVETPPPGWPHYVALKSAVEGLTRTAAAEYPKVSFCIARPAKLRTDLVNTPIGRANAEDPTSAALRILSAAVAQTVPGQVVYVS